jgi:16S rRNA C967 or C1407 C5-methylase (RsmB/RsmF family)/NOL1/NOP2/fmu family ribosome biogenesis protein
MALPQALLNSLEKAPGFNRNAFEAVHASEEQIVSIRKNPDKKAEPQPINIDSAVPWCPHGYYLKERPIFTADPLFHAGTYYVQEASSMFLWHILQSTIGNNTKNKKVLDLSAAPGGKSTLLLSYFSDGLVVANEVIKSRANILVENITKWGTDHVVVTNNDPVHFQKLPAFFDVIVVDAPCSGSGLFRKDPQAIEEWSPEAVTLCSERQERILADILPALAENGLLIYSTCSYSVEENEFVADWLIDKMALEPVPISINNDWGIIQTITNGFRFYPNQVKGEGFFAAVFRKPVADPQHYLKEQSLTSLNKTEKIIVEQFCKLPAIFSYFKIQDEIRVIHNDYQTILQQLAAHLYIKKAGIALGMLKGKDFVPAHDFAVSIFKKIDIQQVELSEDQAMDYLRRKDLFIEGPKGWVLCTYQQQGLGWAKLLPNRLNNYYPSEWRIRKDSF